MFVPHQKARSFTFIDNEGSLTLSLVTDDGVHKYIDITPSQGCLASAQLEDFRARYAKMGVEASQSILPPCDVC
jgi:hypothetical protein